MQTRSHLNEQEINKSNDIIIKINSVNVNCSLKGFLIRIRAALNIYLKEENSSYFKTLRNFIKGDKDNNNYLLLIEAINKYLSFLLSSSKNIETAISSNTHKSKLSDYKNHFLSYDFHYIIMKNKEYNPLDINFINRSLYREEVLKRKAKFSSKNPIEKSALVIKFNTISDLIILLDLCIILNNKNIINLGEDFEIVNKMKGDLIELTLDGRITNGNLKIEEIPLIKSYFFSNYNNKYKNDYCKEINKIILKYISNACLSSEYQVDKKIFDFNQEHYLQNCSYLKDGACFSYAIIFLEYYAIHFHNNGYSYNEIENIFKHDSSYIISRPESSETLESLESLELLDAKPPLKGNQNSNLIDKLVEMNALQWSMNYDYNQGDQNTYSYFINKIEKEKIQLFEAYSSMQYFAVTGTNYIEFPNTNDIYTGEEKDKHTLRFMTIVKSIFEFFENKNEVFKTVFPTKAIFVSDFTGKYRFVYGRLWKILMDRNNFEPNNSNIIFVFFIIKFKGSVSHAVSLYINKEKGWCHFFDPNFGLYAISDINISEHKFSNLLIQRLQRTYLNIQSYRIICFDILKTRSRRG